MPNQSSRTVVVALVTNLGVAFAKLLGAVATRSTVMSAEASHAFADTGNQVLLLIAQRRSDRAADRRHPLGYGREAYFWALIASIVVFTAGAAFSLREGVLELLHPIQDATFLAVYVVLAISTVLDSLSLYQAVRQLRSEAHLFRRDFVDQVMLTSDPTVRAVFAEDAAAIAGDIIGFVAVGTHQATGSSVPEGIGAVLIGLLLIGVGWQLARRNRDFLLGEQAPPSVIEAVREFLLIFPGVVSIEELLVTFVGPRQIWVVARLDIIDTLTGAEVEQLTRAIELGIEEESSLIRRVDVVSIGAGM